MTAHELPAPVPPYPGAGLPAAEVARILHRLDPAALQEAGAAHTALGRELDTMAAQLTQESRTLAQHWSGLAARRALAQFQRLHTQTATLATQASRTGAVLTWLGTQVVPAFRHPADATQAQQYLTDLSAALVRANGTLPPEIGLSGTAQLASAAAGPAGPGSPGSAADPGSGGSGLASDNPASTSNLTVTASPTNPSKLVITGSPAGPANLMGAAGNAPGGPATSATFGNPASQGTPASPTSPEAPVSTTGPSSSLGPRAIQPAPLVSRLTIRPTHAKQLTGPRPVDQDSGLSGGALPLRPAPTDPAPPAAGTPVPVSPASHNTPGALPLAGGAASQPEHERHRDSWAPEDRNPWGLPDTCVPPLIEGP